MINREFFQALEEFAKEKIISREVLVDALESGIAAAYKKENGESKIRIRRCIRASQLNSCILSSS